MRILSHPRTHIITKKILIILTLLSGILAILWVIGKYYGFSEELEGKLEKGLNFSVGSKPFILVFYGYIKKLIGVNTSIAEEIISEGESMVEELLEKP